MLVKLKCIVNMLKKSIVLIHNVISDLSLARIMIKILQGKEMSHYYIALSNMWCKCSKLPSLLTKLRTKVGDPYTLIIF